MKIVVFLFIVTVWWPTYAQVTHNFKVDPEKTDCHDISLHPSITLDSALKVVNKATYRVSEEMKISRYNSPRRVTFKSCNGQVGFLIAEETTDRTILYQSVPKTLWDSLKNNPDPIVFYNSSIFKKYLVKKIDD